MAAWLRDEAELASHTGEWQRAIHAYHCVLNVRHVPKAARPSPLSFFLSFFLSFASWSLQHALLDAVGQSRVTLSLR